MVLASLKMCLLFRWIVEQKFSVFGLFELGHRFDLHLDYLIKVAVQIIAALLLLLLINELLVHLFLMVLILSQQGLLPYGLNLVELLLILSRVNVFLGLRFELLANLS